MSAAQVHALQRLDDFQAALQTFRDKAKNAMESNSMELRRSRDWLEAQLQFWKGEIRRAEEAVFKLKALIRGESDVIIKNTLSNAVSCNSGALAARRGSSCCMFGNGRTSWFCTTAATARSSGLIVLGRS